MQVTKKEIKSLNAAVSQIENLIHIGTADTERWVEILEGLQSLLKKALKQK